MSIGSTREPLPRLTTAQAAARLGVRPRTLYTYVSRGLIASTRDEAGGSTFDALEVEALAARHERDARRGPVRDEGAPLMVLESELTLLRDDELHHRGVRAADLAERWGFEAAAGFLWSGRTPDGEAPPFEADPAAAAAARAAGDALGPAGGPLDRIALAVRFAGAADPARRDLAPEAVHAAGRRMIATAVDALPSRCAPTGPTIAARLRAALSGRPPSAGDVGLLDAALVLGMDHDLAVSTFAARVAASARTDPYTAVGAALAAFDGPLHGAASAAAHELLVEVLRTGDPQRALARRVRDGRGTPGFGHVLYRRRDPRAEALLARMAALPAYRPVVVAVDRLAAAVAERLDRPANVDLALAALAVAQGMPSDAGQTLFAIARMAGWTAHVAEELGRAPLRLRPRSRYTGAEPSSG